jgi:hypothetical protein
MYVCAGGFGRFVRVKVVALPLLPPPSWPSPPQLCLRACVRVCPCAFGQSSTPNKRLDLRTLTSPSIVDDPDLAYRPLEVFSDVTVDAQGRWLEAGGPCVDTVLNGCFNNGTCVAPDTVRALCLAPKPSLACCMLVRVYLVWQWAGSRGA